MPSGPWWEAKLAASKERRKVSERERTARKYAVNRVWMASLKHAVGCQVCGEDYWGALDFHHVGDEGKDGILANGWAWSAERRFREMEKCVLLCANCHRKVHGGLLRAPAIGSVDWRSVADTMALLTDVPVVEIGSGAPRVGAV